MIKIILSILLRIYRKLFRHAMSNRILVINNGAIGDLICSTPFYKSIKTAKPDLEITLITQANMIDVLQGNPFIDKIISRNSISDLSRYFDTCFILSPSTKLFYMASKLLPRKIFSICPNFGRSSVIAAKILSDNYIEYRNDKTVLETYLDLLPLIGIEYGSIEKHFQCTVCEYPQAVSATSISINISTGNKIKEWGAEQFKDLLQKIEQVINSPTFYLLGTSQDRAKGQKISATSTNVYNLSGKYSLHESAHIIKNSTIFIGFDSALSYIADTTNTPIIYISGPTDFSEQRPMGRDVRIIYNPDIKCRPCSFVYKTRRTCTNEIPKECLTTLDIMQIAEECKSLIPSASRK